MKAKMKSKMKAPLKMISEYHCYMLLCFIDCRSGFTPSASLMSSEPLALASGHPELKELLTSGLNPRLFSTLKTLAVNGSDGSSHAVSVLASAYIVNISPVMLCMILIYFTNNLLVSKHVLLKQQVEGWEVL